MAIMQTRELGDMDWLPALMTWLSPAYPVGAYAYSHGLEQAVETGQARDRGALQDYVACVLEQGGGSIDLVLLASAWRAAVAEDRAAILEIAELAQAMRATSELSLETMQQGAAFAAATRAAWPGTALDELEPEVLADLAYPVTVGLACAGRVPLRAALVAFAQACAANLVSAGLRLIPLGQTDGQRALAALAPVARRAAERAAVAKLEDIGAAAPLIEIASMRHETQYTRLFRS
jgi:urease accessory protein